MQDSVQILCTSLHFYFAINSIVDFGVFLLGTDHEHYVNRPRYSINTADFDMRDGSSYKAKKVLVYNTEKPYGNNIELKNDYDFEWTEIDEKWFLMVEI